MEGELVLDPAAVKNPSRRKKQISWRLFELSPKDGSGAVVGTSLWRLRETVKFRLWQSKSDNAAVTDTTKAKPPKLPEPLTKSQLNYLAAHYDRTVEEIEKNPKRSRSELLSLTSVMQNEFQLAGNPEAAAKYQPESLADDASFKDVLSAMQFHLRLKRTEKADSLLPRLLPAIRKAHASGAKISGLTGSSTSGSLASLRSSNTDPIEFFKRHRLQLLDSFIAGHLQNRALSSRGRTSVSAGTMSVYRNSNGSFRSIQVKGPLSLELIDQSLARELLALQQTTGTGSAQSQAVKVDEEILNHLVTPLADAPVFELKSRASLAAFAYWWMEQPQKCYDILAGLSKQYPDDVNLRIEQARLASELGNDREALDILNSFDPLDSKMLVRKEMAALNLAARVSDEKRAAQAAERLFGMRMDTTTQLALSEQLRQLGMKDKAAAVLQRLRGGRKQTDSTSLQIAQSFMNAGDKVAAAEVAFQVLRSVNRSRNQQGNYEYYKRQAVEILKSANRLDPLIAMAKRRVDSAPKSVAARTELAELYTAAGKKDEADKLWAAITKDAPANPAQLMTQAKGLAAAGKNKEAVGMYLKAFQKQPQLINTGYYELQNAAQRAKAWDEVYVGLLKIPANRIPEYRIDEFIRGDYNNRSETFSEQQMKFIIHVLKAGSAGRSLSTILSKITDEQKEQYPEIRQSIISTVTNDAAFQPNSQTWAIKSYSSNGTVDGGVKAVIEFIANDEEARDAFNKAVKKQQTKTKSGEAYMARFLQAMVKLKLGDKDKVVSAADEILTIIKELETTKARQNDPSNQATWNGRFSEAFLWQAGNLMGTVDGIPNKPQFLITVYESAPVGEQRVNGGDPRYSILYPMIQAYKDVGQPEVAVQRLMKAYRALDNSEQNQYNPGYGDYQDLRSWQWIAEQLQNCDAPFQALAIYRRALADPSKFEKAKRYGGRTDSTPFKVGAKKAAASINKETAIKFLNIQLVELTSETESRKQLDLQMLPIAAFEDAETIPGFLMAINEAKKSEGGLNSLKELATALQQQSEKEGAHWSVTGAQLMIAANVAPEQIGDLSTRLSSLLPSEKDIRTSPTGQTRYLDCFAVALAVSQSDHADAKPTVEKITSLLKLIITAKSESNAMLVLEKRFGDPRKAVDRMLSELESNSKTRAPNKDQVALALKIAISSAKEKDWEGSTRAFKAALGNGPPLVGISTNTSGDAFAITNNRSSSNRNLPTDQPSVLNAQVLELVAIYSEHLKLAEIHEDSWQAANVSSQIKEDAKLIFAALLNVVIPQSLSAQVELYEREIASTRNYDRISNGRAGMKPNSAAKVLTEVAALTERFDDVAQRLKQRISKPTAESTILQIQLALQKKNGPELAEAIRSFEAIVNDVLPSPDTVAASISPSNSISSQMQAESYQKSQVVNQVLHAVWDVAMQPDLKDSPAAASADRLLRRTMALIVSDQYTAGRHRQILSNLQSRSVQQAAATGNQSLLSSIVKNIRQSIASQYAGSNTESMAAAQRGTLFGILDQMTEAGNIAESYGIVRQIIESQGSIRRDYKQTETARTLIQISELPKAEQYELLKKVTLGDRDDADVLHWMGFVRAAKVPELVRAQTPNYGKHTNLPVCMDVAPITDTALMLAELAADLGHSKELVKILKSRSQASLDNAALIAALVELTANPDDGYANLQTLFELMYADLQKKKPSADNRELKIPELQLILTLKAMQAGMPSKVANEFTNTLKHYSVYGQQNPLTAAIGAVRASSGFGRAAGGTVKSPLKHFMTFSVPWYSDPEPDNLRPLHAVNESGWISSTGGYNINLLMLKYPVAGSFTMSASIKDGSWGEADVSYGGVLYQPAGWNKQASINVLRSVSEVKVPVENIEANQLNQEGLTITPETISGTCNDVAYLEDISTDSYPWPAVTQYSFRTTQWKGFQITGRPVIPRQVNLLDSTMRGWGSVGYGSFLPTTNLPTKAGTISILPEASARNLHLFKDGVLTYEPDDQPNRYDPGEKLQYLRPILDGETLSWKFMWEKDKTEIHPMLDRIVFKLSKDGTQPVYTTAASDLSVSKLTLIDELDPILDPMAIDNTPKEGEWNTVTMSRSADSVEVKMNGKTIVTVPVTDQTARPGFHRESQKGSQIKDMILTGDWPETLPDDLMEKAE